MRAASTDQDPLPRRRTRTVMAMTRRWYSNPSPAFVPLQFMKEAVGGVDDQDRSDHDAEDSKGGDAAEETDHEAERSQDLRQENSDGDRSGEMEALSEMSEGSRPSGSSKQSEDPLARMGQHDHAQYETDERGSGVPDGRNHTLKKRLTRVALGSPDGSPEPLDQRMKVNRHGMALRKGRIPC